MDPELIGTRPPPQISFSKTFDTFCPMGPCITSAEVCHLLSNLSKERDGIFHHHVSLELTRSLLQLIPDPHTLSLRTRINGQLRQDGHTSDLFFQIPYIIEFCSQGTTLQAGSVILTGTPGGVGYAMKPPQWLKPGDVVQITIGNMTLVNGVKYV